MNMELGMRNEELGMAVRLLGVVSDPEACEPKFLIPNS